MSNRLAKIVSIVLHPLLMPSIIFVLLFSFIPIAVKPFPATAIFRILGFIFVMTYVVPLSSVLLLRLNYLGFLVKFLKLKFARRLSNDEALELMESEGYGDMNDSGIWMKTKQERVTPFAFISIWYGLCTYFFIMQGQFNFIFTVILGSTTLVLVLITIITTKWKISVHSAGIMGLLGFLLAINLKYPGNNLLVPVLVTVLACGVVMSSRLQLNDHDSSQVYAGSILGFAVSFGAIYLFI